MALDDGLIHGESLLQDVPRRFGDYRPGNFDSGFHGPVSVSEALQRSLNLPAVQLLEALGPKNVAARLRNVGLNLRFPAGGEPNLSLVLGGTGARLDDIVAAYSALPATVMLHSCAGCHSSRCCSARYCRPARRGLCAASSPVRRSLPPAGGRRYRAAGVENRHQLRLSRCGASVSRRAI